MYTFNKARGMTVGSSLVEDDQVCPIISSRRYNIAMADTKLLAVSPGSYFSWRLPPS